MKLIPLFLFFALSAIAAFAWNPPVGTCTPEALHKIDHFVTLQEGGIIKNSKYFTVPLDSGKCFLHGYDLYVEGSNLGIENKKTGDKLEYKGKEDRMYNFGCKKMDTPDNENCVSIGIEDGVVSSETSKINNGDTTWYFIIFGTKKIILATGTYVKTGRSYFENSMLKLEEDKSKNRLEAFWESSIGGEYRKANGTNIKKTDGLISALDKLFFDGFIKPPKP